MTTCNVCHKDFEKNLIITIQDGYSYYKICHSCNKEKEKKGGISGFQCESCWNFYPGEKVIIYFSGHNVLCHPCDKKRMDQLDREWNEREERNKERRRMLEEERREIEGRAISINNKVTEGGEIVIKAGKGSTAMVSNCTASGGGKIFCGAGLSEEEIEEILKG